MSFAWRLQRSVKLDVMSVILKEGAVSGLLQEGLLCAKVEKKSGLFPPSEK
jgi:hypothetical protein